MPDARDQLNGALGPDYRYSDLKTGDQIRYRSSSGEVRTGTILHVCAPRTAKNGMRLPLTYVVASGRGWPDSVYQADVLQPDSPSPGPRQCPRCGQTMKETDVPAESRCGLGEICPACGTGEAIEAFLQWAEQHAAQMEEEE